MSGPGRPRDPSIDRAVLEVARRHLAQHGYDGMSMVAVAAEAGTTRQALYRRWPHKADLAAAAVASLSATPAPSTGDIFLDLVGELRDFRDTISRPDGLSMVGTMLQDTTDEELRRRYRENMVGPRRHRLRKLFERGVEEGLLDPDADIEAALPLLTGSWYARSLADDEPIADWAPRTAALVWRALGGTPTPQPQPQPSATDEALAGSPVGAQPAAG